MFFGLGGRVYGSESNIAYLWRHQDTSNNSRENPESIFKNIIVGNLKLFEIENCGVVGKDVCREILKICLNNS